MTLTQEEETILKAWVMELKTKTTLYTGREVQASNLAPLQKAMQDAQVATMEACK